MGKNKEPSPDKVYSRNEFAQIARGRGWTVDRSRGKGGHWWFEKEGCQPFPVPSVVLGRRVQEKIKKLLGITR